MINGYNGLYFVSNNGQVKSIKKRNKWWHYVY